MSVSLEELTLFFDEIFREKKLISAILSSPFQKDSPSKVSFKALENTYQMTEHRGQKDFHRQLSNHQCIQWSRDHFHLFKQSQWFTTTGDFHLLIGKKGHYTLIEKKPTKTNIQETHNRKKAYLIPEGEIVPFLIELGILKENGQIAHGKGDKFRQINRFLEHVEEIIPYLDTKTSIRIVDLGCGKAYLTFALHYFFKTIKHKQVHIVGIDLKKEVIKNCQQISRKLGIDHELQFVEGDIRDFKPRQLFPLNARSTTALYRTDPLDRGEFIAKAIDEKRYKGDAYVEQSESGSQREWLEPHDEVDLVVSLHACDTATDAALEKALEWKAKVILAVPCCHKELLPQIIQDNLTPILKHGILKERFASLATDAARALMLEAHGYQTQVIEFIDPEYTAKNILIRAHLIQSLSKEKRLKKWQEYLSFKEFLHISPSLERFYPFDNIELS